MGLSASRPRAWRAEILAGRDCRLAEVKELFDKDVDWFEGDSNSRRIGEGVDVSEKRAIEFCGARLNVEAVEMKQLRQAM